MSEELMTPEQIDWLDANRQYLLGAQIPALDILDDLVARKIFDTRRDDYQIIGAKETPSEQIRALLDALKSKNRDAFTAFISALERHCLHVLQRCREAPDVFRQFDGEMRTYFRALDEEEMLAFSWLERRSARIKITDYLRHLVVVDKRQFEAMADHRLASSTRELERQQRLQSQTDAVELVELENIFCDEPRNRHGDAISSSADQPQTHTSTADTNTTSGSAVSDSVEQEAHTPLWNQPRKRVGLYGAAGCGKTASLMKLVCLYARGKLWQNRFRAFLLWRLRDRNVAEAKTFEQILVTLPFSLSFGKCKEFAETASACDGRGLLVALDGVDELDTSLGKNTFVWRLLEGSVLRQACILVTSRPCSVARNFFKTYTINLELLGFREEQVTKFVHQRLGHRPELVSKLESTLARNASTAVMMSVPLLAFLVCEVFAACPDRPPTTRTQLFSKLLTLIVQRAVAEGRVCLANHQEEEDLQDGSGLHQIGGKAKELLLELAKVAWEAMKKDLATFDHTLIRTTRCSPEALELGLLTFDRRVVEEHSVAVRWYSFHHMTVQEFLVALLLVEETGDSEEKLREKLGKLEMGPHQYMVIQFLAGLLPDHLLPRCGLARLFPAHLLPAAFRQQSLQSVLFSFLNSFLHQNWNARSAECQDRLRLCLQCVREAYVDEKSFPHTLQLPKKVRLHHVSAADMELLSLSIENSPSSLQNLRLVFDCMGRGAVKTHLDRVQTQTRNAWQRLSVALTTCKSLRTVSVHGPSYKLFTDDSWRSLMKILRHVPLRKLNVLWCDIGDEEVCALAGELQHNTKLRVLWLRGNVIGDRGVRMVADSLKHNRTLKFLGLVANSFGQESKDIVKQQLHHIPELWV